MIEKRGANMRKIVIVLVGAVLLGWIGFWVYDWLKKDRLSDEVSVKKDNAESLDVDIQFGVGKLLIEGGATEWVDGDIDTNTEKLYPSVTYKNKRDVGYVEIQQKKKRFMAFGPFGKKRSNWNLQLTNEIPVELDIETGVSESELKLRGIRLNHLSVDAGVGSTTLDLAGNWQESFDAEIDLGVGGAEIYLPRDTGVKLTVSKGIGSIETKDFISKGKDVYVNEAYDQSDIKISMKVNVGVGGVKFMLVE